VYCSDNAWAMVGIKQQNTTFCFAAGYNDIASKNLQVKSVLDNRFGA
jgi:hypothetical protein